MVEANQTLNDINVLGTLAAKPVLLGIGLFVTVFIFIDLALFALGLGGIFYKNTNGLTPQDFVAKELSSAWETFKAGWQQMQQGAQQIWDTILGVLRGDE